MANPKLSPFLRIVGASFPANVDILSVQVAVSRPSGDPFASISPKVAQSSLSLVFTGGPTFNSIGIAQAVSGAGNGAIFSGNLGSLNGSVSPVNPFSGAMVRSDLQFSPAGNSQGVQSASGTNTQGAHRGYLFCNLTLMRNQYGLSDGNIGVIDVTMGGSRESSYNVLLEIFKTQRNFPFGTFGTLALQSNVWGLPRFYHAQKLGSGNTTSSTGATSVDYSFNLRGMGGNYSIIDNGNSGLAGNMSVSFSAGSG